MYCEFNSFGFYVKDMASNEVKLQGTSYHGLQKVESFVPCGVLSECVLVDYHAFMDTWARDVGLPFLCYC